MIPEFGHFALILALCLACVQAVLPMLGAAYDRRPWMSLAYATAWGQFVFIGFSFIALGYALVSNDFSVAYVAENSNSQLPLIYRFCALWGAHEGSLLLWVWLLSVWMVAVSVFSRNLPLIMVARVLAVLAIISVGFLLLILTTSNPFLRLLTAVPSEGRDLNPILQDPGLVTHPPMLYMGYVGMAVTFAFAISALISGRLDSAWARWSRPWTLLAWCFLTLGIILGSMWAYRELGWGGWWFWDPVENASFLPWLVATALIHSLIVAEKRNTFKAWTVLLAIVAFALSLMGTFLVRSGVLISVHAFAEDPRRGAFILKFLVLIIGGALILYAWRARTIRSIGHFSLCSRETLLLTNNTLLMVAMVAVLLGTVYPLAMDTLGLAKLSVGKPYFDAVFVPIMIPLLILLGVAPHCYWNQHSPRKLLTKLWITLLVAVGLAVLLPWLWTQQFHPVVIVGVAIALWIIASTGQHVYDLWQRSRKAGHWPSRRYWGMVIAHLGVAVTVLGVVISTTYTYHRDVQLTPGQQATVGSYNFKMLDSYAINGPNYTGTQVAVQVSHDDQPISTLFPEARIYNVEKMAFSKAAIDTNGFRDLYVALGEPIGEQGWTMRIYDKPFIRWIWLGGLLMIIGGILALTDKRYRLKIKIS